MQLLDAGTARQLELDLPLYALEHHEVITGSVPELRALDFEVPTVRDPQAPSNVRQEGSGFLCGVYEAHPRFWAVEGIPPDFGEDLLPPDLERLEPHLLRVIERLPAFGEAGVKAVNNGPICYAPDGCPLLGPVEGHEGLWLAAGFAVGIGTGGGSGEFLAHWMVEGEPACDLPMVHPSRFSNDLTRARCLALIRETYAEGTPFLKRPGSDDLHPRRAGGSLELPPGSSHGRTARVPLLRAWSRRKRQESGLE